MVDLEPRELVDPAADEREHYDQAERDRLTELVGPGCDLLDDFEVERLMRQGRRLAVRLLASAVEDS